MASSCGICTTHVSCPPCARHPGVHDSPLPSGCEAPTPPPSGSEPQCATSGLPKPLASIRYPTQWGSCHKGGGSGPHSLHTDALRARHAGSGWKAAEVPKAEPEKATTGPPQMVLGVSQTLPSRCDVRASVPRFAADTAVHSVLCTGACGEGCKNTVRGWGGHGSGGCSHF